MWGRKRHENRRGHQRYTLLNVDLPIEKVRQQRLRWAVRAIGFVPHKDHVKLLLTLGCLCSRLCSVINVIDPVDTILKGDVVRDIVHQQDARRFPVKGRCDAFETFLSGRVPQQQIDALLVDRYFAYFVVQADGGDEAVGKGTVGVAGQKGGFADSGITNQDQMDGRYLVSF